MRAAFFDLIGGASGNMLFGAFVDAGTNFDEIVKILETIPVDGWSIVRERTQRRGVAATYIDVIVAGEDDHHSHRHPPGRRSFREIIDIFERSGLTPAQRALATTIASRLVLPDERFHPVGQIDAIIDIAATCVALDLLGIERCFCSPFPSRNDLGGGLQMVTATGAAILSTLVEQPGRRPELRVELNGYGAGRSDFPVPNVIRLEVGPLV